MIVKYLTAIVSAIFIFFASFLLIGLGLSIVLPIEWSNIYINLGLLKANMLSIISAIVGSIAATYTFKASLYAKTGKLYRKNAKEKSIDEDKK